MFWRKFRDKIESQKCKGEKKKRTNFLCPVQWPWKWLRVAETALWHSRRTDKTFCCININIDVRIKIKPKLCNNSTAASIGKRKTWKRRRNWRKRFPGPWAKPFLCLLCLWIEISQTLNKLQILFGFTSGELVCPGLVHSHLYRWREERRRCCSKLKKWSGPFNFSIDDT